VGLSSLPQKAKYYYKYYRDVKIFDEILGFIVPSMNNPNLTNKEPFQSFR